MNYQKGLASFCKDINIKEHRTMQLITSIARLMHTRLSDEFIHLCLPSLCEYEYDLKCLHQQLLHGKMSDKKTIIIKHLAHIESSSVCGIPLARRISHSKYVTFIKHLLN